jgi:hypothetical protein
MSEKPQRMMAEIDGDFAVSLIGMKLNRPWRVDRWALLALTMPPFGLGAASRLVPVTPERASARQRMTRKTPVSLETPLVNPRSSD